MKSTSNDSLLDRFIKDVLKNPDPELQPIDWSEIAVLLRHEQKPIAFLENKRFRLYSGIGLASVILIGVVFALVRYYISLPSAEAEKTAGSTQTTLKKATDSSASAMKTAKIGDAFVNEEEDAISDTILEDTISTKKIPIAEKPASMKEKKKKQDTVLSVIDTTITEKTKTEELLSGDTIPTFPAQEIKIETPSDIDTSHKKFSLWPKKSKNKKNLLR